MATCTWTVKGTVEVQVPQAVATCTGPVVAPGGTAVVIWPSSTTVKAALAPPKATWVAPVK